MLSAKIVLKTDSNV